jgi:hypothetical protein
VQLASERIDAALRDVAERVPDAITRRQAIAALRTWGDAMERWAPDAPQLAER